MQFVLFNVDLESILGHTGLIFLQDANDIFLNQEDPDGGASKIVMNNK
jgi:hypothetical protein